IIKGTKGRIIYRDLTTKCVRIDRNGAELYVFSTIDSIFSNKRVIKKINKVFKIINNQSLPADLPAEASAEEGASAQAGTINNPCPPTCPPKLQQRRKPRRRGEQSSIRMVYSCFPMFVDYFSGLKADLTIFDAIDNWAEHPSFAKYQNILEKNYKIISQKSDLIFTVSEDLKEFFQERGRTKDVYWIPNGVDINHFAPPATTTSTTTRSDLVVGVVDDVFRKIARPIIGYLGTIQHRFDVELLGYLAKNNPKKSFVLAGPIWQPEVKKILKKYKNIYLTGRVPYSQAPNYINYFDVAIIPHKLDKFVISTYSLKLLEYLSYGKPVVTTPTPDTEKFRDVIYRASNYEDFDQKINLALKEDSPSLIEQRIERVKKETWGIKIGEMMKIIGGLATKLLMF
ncbi:glycosyltransferase, partial [bacterium]|nr:glycosyltransferase [bacterium]